MKSGNRIREFRKANGMTLQELAEKVGIPSKNNLASIESGTRTCSLALAEKISKVLGVSVAEILGTDAIKSKYKNTDDLKDILASSLKEQSSSFYDMVRIAADQYSYRIISKRPVQEELAKDYDLWQIIFTILGNYKYLNSKKLQKINKILTDYIRAFVETERTEDIKNELFKEESSDE